MTDLKLLFLRFRGPLRCPQFRHRLKECARLIERPGEIEIILLTLTVKTSYGEYMKKTILGVTLFVLSSVAMADPTVIIRLGGSAGEWQSNYSQQQQIENLRDRVRELERAMVEMQSDYYHLMAAPKPAPGPRFECKVTDMNAPFFGQGDTPGEAHNNALKKCEKNGDYFFCKDDAKSCTSI